MSISQPPIQFEPECLATTLGSLPHYDLVQGTALVLASTPEIPAWAQFPKVSFLENMMVQYSAALPGLVAEPGRIYLDTRAPDFVDQLTDFYTHALAAEAGDPAALAHFGLTPAYGGGFGEFMRQLPERLERVVALKGQVTGPFTLGINLVDQERRCIYYDETLRDVVIRTVALNAAWQMDQLARFRKPVMIFLDEPSLLNYGSQTFITVSREDITGDINRVVEVIHGRGGLAGVHCEANTDWSILMETGLDILDFDAYDHLDGLSLYPAELKRFLGRGGILGWGIVPTLDREAAGSESTASLAARFEAGVDRLAAKGVDRDVLRRQALITPSCGAGGVLDQPLAERVLGLLPELSGALRARYGFTPRAGAGSG